PSSSSASSPVGSPAQGRSETRLVKATVASSVGSGLGIDPESSHFACTPAACRSHPRGGNGAHPSLQRTFPSRGFFAAPLAAPERGSGELELAVLDAARPARIFFSHAPPSVLLVGLVVALEPHHLAVALEGEDVGGDPVQKPTIVADDHGAPRKV